MVLDVTQKLSYGMYVVASLAEDKPNGCIANCAVQITAEPATFAVSVNHDNYTNECIKKTGKFSVSVLGTDCAPAIIGTFGFKSGRTADKFTDVPYITVEDMPVITNSCGYLVCKVIDTMETPTHTVFLGKLIASETLSDVEPMTYAYYHKVIKGKSPKNAPTYVADKKQTPPVAEQKKMRKFVCSVCGYEYEGYELPDDFECPICGVGKEMFKEVDA